MNGNLRWKFDVSAFRLIGRDLITDRVTALFELVKNSYDANAQKVTVTFSNVGIEEEGPDNRTDDGYYIYIAAAPHGINEGKAFWPYDKCLRKEDAVKIMLTKHE